jgi:hypothetical protein
MLFVNEVQKDKNKNKATADLCSSFACLLFGVPFYFYVLWTSGSGGGGLMRHPSLVVVTQAQHALVWSP